MIKISIVIPTYNEEYYLPELLDSIKSQEFGDYEIIIADADSQDGTCQIAKDYNCKIVKGGIPAIGRNNGAKIARGELILFLDSDLILPPGYLQDVVSEFEERKLGIGITQMIPISNKKRDKLLHELANRFMIMVESIKPHGAGCYGIICRRKLHEKVNGFNESLDFGEDADYIERMGSISKFKVLRRPYLRVSTRRLEKEGLKNLAVKYAKSTVYDFLGRKVSAAELDYAFGYKSQKLSSSSNETSLSPKIDNPNSKKRIIYSVCGEGMGHAIRSGVILEELISRYEVLIFASDRAYDYLSRKFDNVYEIFGFNTVYENNQVKNKDTFFQCMKKLPRDLKGNLKLLYSIASDFKPHIIISDFEFYASLLSNILRIPLISIDNMHIISQGKINYPSKFKKDKLKAEAVVRSFIVRPERYIITSFFFPPLKNLDNAVIHPPVLRKEIIELNPGYGDHIMVYQTSTSNWQLIEILKKINKKVVIYGFNKNQKIENLHFKIFNENEFFTDLEQCQAVITNGGFGLITEALYLKKPIYSIPVKGQFEQILNGVYIEKLGYGEFHEETELASLQLFLKHLYKYQKNLLNYPGLGNAYVLEDLISSIEKYSKNYC